MASLTFMSCIAAVATPFAAVPSSSISSRSTHSVRLAAPRRNIRVCAAAPEKKSDAEKGDPKDYAHAPGRHFSDDASRDFENQEEGPGSDPVPKDGPIVDEKETVSKKSTGEDAKRQQ